MHPSLITAWLKAALGGLMLLAVGSILLWLSYRWISRRLELAPKKPKLSVIMVAFFRLSQHSHSHFHVSLQLLPKFGSDVGNAQRGCCKTRQASIENVEAMIHGVAGTLRVLAEVTAANPDFFRTEGSGDVLFRVLTSAEEIDAAFVSFENGYHRAVTRIDDNRRRSDPKIPLTANWHMKFIDDFSAGANRSRHRTFFDTWGHIVGEYAVPTKVDYRAISGIPGGEGIAGVGRRGPRNQLGHWLSDHQH